MSLPSFHDWRANRSQEAPAAERLAFVIAQSGAAGISVDRLRTVVGLPPETLQDILRALAAAGPVTMLKINGQPMYRAATQGANSDCGSLAAHDSFGPLGEGTIAMVPESVN
jgi:hypothetical protein